MLDALARLGGAQQPDPESGGVVEAEGSQCVSARLWLRWPS